MIYVLLLILCHTNFFLKLSLSLGCNVLFFFCFQDTVKVFFQKIAGHQVIVEKYFAYLLQKFLLAKNIL